MTQNIKQSTKYLGMRNGDLSGKAYAKYWNAQMAPLPNAAVEAICRGPMAPVLFTGLDEAKLLTDQNSDKVENGFALTPDGGLLIAINTEMPGSTPEMVDWWFAWHSDEPERYKLWHPKAHVHARWEDGKTASDYKNPQSIYIGRTSIVDEYVGSELGTYAIQFIDPKELELDKRTLESKSSTAICARVGFAGFPINFGYLIHHVIKTASGSVMRSRFWVGPPFATARPGNSWAAPMVEIAKMVKAPNETNARNLLVHCAEEMAHLASFLPALYKEFA